MKQEKKKEKKVILLHNGITINMIKKLTSNSPNTISLSVSQIILAMH